MERITLRSGEDVKAFIKAQDEARQQACAVFIASRAALRASPTAIQFFEFDEGPNFTSLMTWRPLFTSSVAVTMPTDAIKYAAEAAIASYAAPLAMLPSMLPSLVPASPPTPPADAAYDVAPPMPCRRNSQPSRLPPISGQR